MFVFFSPFLDLRQEKEEQGEGWGVMVSTESLASESCLAAGQK